MVVPATQPLAAIDFHVHALLDSLDGGKGMDELTASGAKALGGGMDNDHSIAGIAQMYRSLNMQCVMFPVDSESATGRAPLPLDSYLAQTAAQSDVIIPFISLDPWKGKKAIHELNECLDQYPVRGVKFHPCTQEFDPADPHFRPLFDAIQERDLIALFHTGQTAIGKGVRGGGGIRLKYGNPLVYDDLAVDFPDLTIVMAHPSVPWQDEAIAVALHKPNVFIDLSGWSPRHFPEALVRQIGRGLQKKVLFGTDYPYITPARWLDAFSSLGLDDEVTTDVLVKNAQNVLGDA